MDSRARRRRVRAALALAALVFFSGCTPRIGITVTNAPTVQDCIPESATRPCR